MKVLFDQSSPVPPRKHLSAHQVITPFELGWSALQNGELIFQAKRAGFEVLVTTDKNLKYQQNLTHRNIAILVLETTSWPRIQKAAAKVTEVVKSSHPGAYVEISIPLIQLTIALTRTAQSCPARSSFGSLKTGRQ